ncbi:MAG TPA: hypothetical protein VGJ91_10410 [Polyangiaceae bacterium]
MAWETRRNGRRYYYRKERQGRRVVSTYHGSDKIASLLAELDALDRERRQQERVEAQIARSEFVALAATPPELALLLAEARAEAARVLTEAGYHQHKRGEWRKRRAKKET